MAAINSRRVLLGALAGGVVWTIWSMCVQFAVLAKRYAAAQEAGLFLKQGRYPLFVVYWIVTLFVLAYIVAWLYAAARETRGAGPGTAFQVGSLVGFAAGFPGALGAAAWAPYTRMIPLWQMLELWVGAILAALVAGFIYRD
jgi:uncharacterized membrane protein YoaK (UPF0700 family)